MEMVNIIIIKWIFIIKEYSIMAYLMVKDLWSALIFNTKVNLEKVSEMEMAYWQ
jgi:hypothetical protein